MSKQNVVTLKETTYQKPAGLYSVVRKCVICGKRHIHSVGEGSRVAHCINLEVPTTYDLVIDRDNVENLRLAEKYNINLGNSLQSEVIANETKSLSN